MKKRIQKLLYIGISDDLSFVQKRNIQITNGVALLLIMVTPFFLLPLLWVTETDRIIENIVSNTLTIVPASIILWLNYRKRYVLAQYILLLFFMVFIFMLPIITHRNVGMSFHLMAIIVSVVLLFNKKYEILIFYLIAALAFITIVFLQSADENYLNLRFDKPLFFINAILAMVMMFFILKAFKDESHRYQKETEESKNELAQKNQQINESIRYARYIQQALIPDFELLKQAFPRSFIFYQPKDIVSGDFYWFHSDAHKHWVVIADCTGHGVPGALMSMLGVSFLEQIIIDKQIQTPNEVLNQLSLSVKKTLRQQTTQNQDGLDIAICRIDTRNNEIQFAAANQSVLLFEQNECKEFKGNRFGIGGKTNREEKDFDIQTFTYRQGSMLYFYSDGYKDQFGGEKNQKFSSKRLKELLQTIHTQSAEEQQNILSETINSWMNVKKSKQIDDISVMGVGL